MVRGTLLALLRSSPGGLTTGKRRRPPVLLAIGFLRAGALSEVLALALVLLASLVNRKAEADLAACCANLGLPIRVVKAVATDNMVVMQ